MALWVLIQLNLNAQSPTVKVDFDKSGRQSSEVTASDYEAWSVDDGESISETFEDVTFTLTYSGNGSGLTSNWYKAGIQSPYYVKLANDGLTVEDGEDGTEIQMTISGLEAGTHTLLLYHNNVDSPDSWTFADIDVYVNGSLSANNIEPSCRVLSESEATISYHTFTVDDNEDVVIRILPDPSSSATNKNVMINGFELNTPNSAYQSYDPEPEDEDYHADADDGSLTLSWSAASTAASHNVYFGTDESEVEDATTSSSVYKGNQTSTAYTLSSLSNLNTYYWRVDEVASDGTVTQGDVWSFRTRILAFPDAEGYGRYAIGGRGGVVVHVTNLNDSGEGSLREAIEDEDLGPRTIVFDVSGIIVLESRLTLGDEFVTVAGQTAPGKGICIRSAPFGMSGAEDVIMQNVRIRLGAGTTFDGTGMAGSNYCIIDHCSVSWTIDEAFSSRSGKNITLQRTLISEALNIAGHENYDEGTAHGYAASIGGDVGSFHHNLLAHCEGRNWSMAGGLDADNYFAGRLDIFNNVVYNWGSRATDGGAHEVNFVGNYYKPGEATEMFYALTANHEDDFGGYQKYYFAENKMPGYFDESNQEDGRRSVVEDGITIDYEDFVDEPFFESYATIQSADDAYKSVLSDVGCTQPVFDDHDIRIVTETSNGTYTYSGSVSGKPGLPDDEDDVGGYEDYPTVYRDSDFDSDDDGLPDWWEEYYGLSTSSGDFSDANADDDGDGYTNLEEYLQWLSYEHYSISGSETVSIDLSDMFRGFTSSPSYSASNIESGSVSISSSTATFTPDDCGMTSFNLTVTDGDGSSMTKLVNVFIEGTCSGAAPFTVADGLFDQSDTNNLGLSVLDEAETITVFQPSSSTDHFSNGVVMTEFNDYLYCMWQSSETDEDSDDTWVAYSRSADGETWTEPMVLAASPSDGRYTSGGWLVNGSTLVAYINYWPEDMDPKGGYALYKTSTDGLSWSSIASVTMSDGSAMEAIFEQDPHVLSDGRIINAAHFQTGLLVNPIYTDDESGTSGWIKADFTNLDYSDDVTRELEPSSFVRDDDAIVMIFRDQNSTYLTLASISYDNGESWTTPVETDMPDSRAKKCAGNLSDGTAYMVSNPTDNKKRIPLAVTISANGDYFDQSYILRNYSDLQDQVYEGQYKSIGYSYPKAMIYDDYLYVSYATNKEDVEFTRIPVSSLSQNTVVATLTKHGGGSSTQSITFGDAITDFYYSWTNATTVSVSGMPSGITTTIDTDEKTVSFTGTPTETGTFAFTVTTVGADENASKSGSITVVSSTDDETIAIEENETGFCDVDGSIDSDNEGFSGDGFANTDNESGAGVDWAIDGDEGTYTFVWNYANGGSTDRSAVLYVNETSVATVSFPATDDWTTWTTASVSADLESDYKSIRLEADQSSGLANIDYMTVTGPSAASADCDEETQSYAVESSYNISDIEEISENSVSIYPNPTSDILYVEAESGVVFIYNMLGNKTYENDLISNITEIDISEYPDGIYMIFVKSADSSFKQTIIKN